MDMQILRTGISLIVLLIAGIHPLLAGEISHRAGLELVSMWGTSSYEITFNDGTSRLEWPMNMKAVRETYVFTYNDRLELELGLISNAWRKNSDPMKDLDWIDESSNNGRAFHGGLDIYSQSELDSKILMINADARIFFFSYRPVAFGLLAGYNYQEMDYRAYNTAQVGYGPWQDHTLLINGPTINYGLEINSASFGLSCRLNLDNTLVITAEASALPYVKATDEDNHLRRSRVSHSACKGRGTELSISTIFNIYRNWNITTRCTRSRISTSGDQTQYWYGDDTGSPQDDTGTAVSNIDARIVQEIFQIDLGLGCKF